MVQHYTRFQTRLDLLIPSQTVKFIRKTPHIIINMNFKSQAPFPQSWTLTGHGWHGDLWTHDIGHVWPDMNRVGLPGVKRGEPVVADEHLIRDVDLMGVVRCQIQSVVIHYSIGRWRPINIQLSATDGSDVDHFRGIWHCACIWEWHWINTMIKSC